MLFLGPTSAIVATMHWSQCDQDPRPQLGSCEISFLARNDWRVDAFLSDLPD
jgi:hypothetical protein